MKTELIIYKNRTHSVFLIPNVRKINIDYKRNIWRIKAKKVEEFYEKTGIFVISI